jgi:hypothetical protein
MWKFIIALIFIMTVMTTRRKPSGATARGRVSQPFCPGAWNGTPWRPLATRRGSGPVPSYSAEGNLKSLARRVRDGKAATANYCLWPRILEARPSFMASDPMVRHRCLPWPNFSLHKFNRPGRCFVQLCWFHSGGCVGGTALWICRDYREQMPYHECKDVVRLYRIFGEGAGDGGWNITQLLLSAQVGQTPQNLRARQVF